MSPSFVTRVLRVAGGSVVAILAIVPSLAHHSIAAKFDRTKPITLSGAVTEIDWANPHAHVFVNVKEPGGRTTNWAVELESTVDLEKSGWMRNTLQIGDVVTVEGFRSKDGSSNGNAQIVTLTNSGQRLFAASSQAQPAQTR